MLQELLEAGDLRDLCQGDCPANLHQSPNRFCLRERRFRDSQREKLTQRESTRRIPSYRRRPHPGMSAEAPDAPSRVPEKTVIWQAFSADGKGILQRKGRTPPNYPNEAQEADPLHPQL